MPELDRRTVVKSAAWAVHLYRPQDYNNHMGPSNNVAEILVTNTAVIVTFRRGTDILDINVHKPSGSVNRHENRKVKPGESIVIPLVDCEDPSFIQVHGNNTHYYGGGVFR
ncbi:hypothetical protein PBI_LEAF_128 [Microbacterium phage Leaf]|nr:hypothetical protein PBI_LEAF_128 [Microbacterium phage Leaf]